MILYHIEKAKYKDVWPPEGSLHGKGRWNKIGQWVIYCSPTISLAKLEILANDNMLPIHRVCMTIQIKKPATIHKLNRNTLPKNWWDFPHNSELTELTEKFLNSGDLLMEVPSAQSPRENNYLINVRHPEFHQLVVLTDVAPELFDPRLK